MVSPSCHLVGDSSVSLPVSLPATNAGAAHTSALPVRDFIGGDGDLADCLSPTTAERFWRASPPTRTTQIPSTAMLAPPAVAGPGAAASPVMKPMMGIPTGMSVKIKPTMSGERCLREKATLP